MFLLKKDVLIDHPFVKVFVWSKALCYKVVIVKSLARTVGNWFVHLGLYTLFSLKKNPLCFYKTLTFEPYMKKKILSFMDE